MVLYTCVRLLLRRLALRKGLALTAASLFLLGTIGLYYVLQDGPGGGGRARTVRVPTIPTRGLNATLRMDNQSDSPVAPQRPNRTSDIQDQRRDKEEESHDEDKHSPDAPLPSVYVVPDTSEECVFSATQPGKEADVGMLEVFDLIPFDDPDGGVWKQGFEVTYSMTSFQEQPLRVFIVPHSHNDPGWLRTFEDYYRRQTRNILTFMTDALSADPRRRFIWAETSYLDLWWQEQTEQQKVQFKRLLARGQVEIVTGGWVMNDEANTHYFGMIDQMIEGHSWLRQNLPGVIPQTGWAIDPFGHTPTMAYLLQRMGLEAMLIQRVHYSVKKHLASHRQLEFAWRQLWDRDASTDIYCHMMPFYSYDIPHTCGPDPRICCQFDFNRLPGSRVNCPWRIRPQAITNSNVADRAEMLADQYRKKSQLFRTNILLVPLGDDFRWDTRREVDAQFSNYDKLIDYMNSHPEMKINVQFGTLSEYFAAVRQSEGVTDHNELIPRGFPSLTGDFYTYSDREDHFWSGYYTSRPFYKHLDRVLVNKLRSAEILYSLAEGAGLATDPNLSDLLTSARRSLGLFQHHDGITGTAKEPVVADYANKMVSALTGVGAVLTTSAQALLRNPNTFTLEETHPSGASLPHHTPLPISRGPQTVTLFNPLPRPRQQLARLRVDSPDVMVKDSENRSLPCQVNPVWVDEFTFSQKEFEVVFLATLAPLSLSSYHLWPGSEQMVRAQIQTINYIPPTSPAFTTGQYPAEDFVLKTDQVEARFSGSSGLLRSLTVDSTEAKVEVDFVTYGTRSSKDRSGAYLFLPDGEARTIVSGRQTVSIAVGPLIQEVCSHVPLAMHCVQLYSSPGVEGRTVGIRNTVDIRTQSNKELAMRLRTSIRNPGGIFYSDLNGIQMVRRQTAAKLPLQGNYYPMPTSAFLQDNSSRLSLLSAQPLGVGALKQGWLEVMLDRRLLQDDGRGLGQGIKDNVITVETFSLLLERRLNNASPTAALVYPSLLAHAAMDELLHPSIALLTPHHPSSSPSYNPLQQPFPCEVYLVNLRSLLTSDPAQSALILHRRGFDCGYNMAPLQCSPSGGKLELGKLFRDLLVSEAQEMSLSLMHEKHSLSPTNGLLAQLDPMHIYTYRLSW